MKLSISQTEILKEMTKGASLTQRHHAKGSDSHKLTYFGGINWKSVHKNSVHGLLDRGYIRSLPYKLGSFETEYVLTDAGMQVVTAPKKNTDPLLTLWNSTQNLYDRFELDAPLSDRVRKFNEEVEEFLIEASKRDSFEDNRDHLAQEAGDVIVTLIGILQKLDVGIEDLYDQLELVAQKNDVKNHETHVVHDGLIMRRSKLNGQ